MKRILSIWLKLAWVVAVVGVLPLSSLFANQYRSAATGNWNVAATWQISTDGGATWTAASNYPGQSTINDTVLVRNGHTVTLNVSPANAIGRLTVGEGASGALSIGGFTITVNGAVIVNNGATVTVTSATGTKSFGSVVLNSGATWTSNAGETYGISGSLTLNGANIGGTGTGVFNVGTDFLVSGTNAIAAATLNVTGSTVVSGSLTFSSTTGTKTFSDVTIDAGGQWNSTAAETYAIGGNLTMNGGTIGGTATGVFNVTGNFNIASGTNTLGTATITVTGTTDISGSLNITSSTGTKTFVGKITINNGGTWDNSTGNSAIVLRGGLENNGTFTSGTGTYTFNTNSQTISGTNGLTFAATGTSLAITGAITIANQTTVTVAGSITGSVGGSTWRNDAFSTLNVAGAMLATGTLNATAIPNLVNYNGTGAQTIKAANYNNLTISGARTTNNVTLPNGGTIGISGTFTPSATFTTGNYVTTGNTVDFNGAGPQSVPALGAANYNNLTRSGSGTATLAANIGVAGNLTVSGGTLDLSTFTANRATAGGTLTVSAGATLRIGGTNSYPTNYTTNTLNVASTVEYYGSTQTISSTPTYGNLTLSGSGPKTTPPGTTTTTVAGNFTLGSGIAYERASGATSTLTLNGTTNVNNGTLGSVGNPFTTINVGNAGGDNLTNNNSINTGSLAITGSLANNSSVIVSGDLSGAGTFTQSASAQLFIGGNATITTLNASANPNTVTYNGSAAQTVKGTTYHNLTISNNPATASLGADATVNNLLTISSGATLSIGASTFAVNGTTDISGTLNITSTTGTKTFNDLTVNGGGTFNNSANEAITINGNIVNDGTFTSGTGVYTLAGTGKTMSGSSALTISNVTVTGSYTNETIFTAAASLIGSGSFTQGVNSTLTIGDLNLGAPTFTVTTFNASASGNTVDYADVSAQTIRVPSDGAYHHLKASTLGAKTAAGGLTVNGDFTIQGFATFNAGTSNTHTFYGSWLVNTTAGTPFSFTTSSTIRFMTPSPAASTSISGSTTATLGFNNLEINNTSGVEVFVNISSSGTLTVGSGATLIPFETITVSGTGTLTGSGNVKVTRTTATPDFLSQYTISNRNLSALTVDYDASGSQQVNALNYFNLIIRGVRGANSVTLNSGTIGISGTFSPIASFTSGGYSTTGNTVDFNGTTAQTVPAFNYNNLSISNSRTTNNVTLASSGTIGVAGTFSPTASFTSGGYVTTGSTIDYNGNGAQSVATFNYHHLTLSNGGTKTFASGTTRIAGDFVINSPATADATTNSSTIEYNGSSLQTTPAVAYSSLTVNNASGIQLSGNASVAGTLNFTTGNIITGSNTISLTSTGTVSRTTGHVEGNFRKFIPTGSPSRTFEIGSGSDYSPITVSFVNVTSSGDLTARTTGTDHPQILLSGIDATKSVNRYWTLTNSGIAFTSYDAVFTFTTGDLDSGADPDSFIVARYSGGSWTQPTVGTRMSTSTQATGLTGFGDFQVGEASAGVVKTWDGGAGTNNWGDGANWNPDGVPTSSDNVNLNGAVTIDINVAAVANSLTLNNGGLVVNILAGQSLTLSGNLSLTGGTLNIAASFPSVSGTTNISGGTVVFNAASGNQNVPALSYNNLSFSGGGTRTIASGTTYIAGTFLISGPTVDATTNNSTIDFNGSSQTVPAINYYNLTFSGTGTKTFSSGTTGIANLFTIGGLVTTDATTNSSTINYNGGGAQTVRAITYHHLSLTNSGTKTFASGTTQIRGNFTVSGATADATTNSTTIIFNGSGSQTVAAINYHNLTFDNAGTKTFAAGTSGISNVLTVTGSASADATTNSTTIQYNGSSSQNVAHIDYHHLTLTNDGVKTFAAGTTNIAGNFIINSPASANVTTNSATIAYNGTSLQTTPVLTYVGLTVNNPAGIQLTGDVSVAGTLTFTTGNIYTGTHMITITSTGTVSRTSGHVVGNLEKYYPFSLISISRTFEVGSGSTYAPVSVTYTNVLTAGYLIVSTAAGDHPQIATSGINDLKSVNRTWTLTNNGIVTAGSYSAVFNFVSSDIDSGANPSNFIAARYSGGTWTTPTVGTRTSTSTQVTGVTGYGDYQLGEAGTSSLKTWDGGAGTNNWGDGDNWSPNGVPTASNNINLNGAFTININVAAVGNSITLDHSGLTLTVLAGNTLTASGTLTINAGTLNTEADFPTAASVVIAGGTVGYTASSGTQTVASYTYNNLTIAGGGTKSLAANIDLVGDLTISGGTLDLGAYTANRTSTGGTLTLGGAGSLIVGGSSGGVTGSNFPANFASFALAGTTEYNGSSAQTVAAVTYGNLVLSNSGMKTISGSVTAQGNLVVQSGATLLVNASGNLQVNGDFENDGFVTNDGMINVGN